MPRKKKHAKDSHDEWTRYDWDSFEKSSWPDNYVDRSHWDDMFFNNHDFFDTYDVRPQWIKNRNGMPRFTTPWLLTMSLLGVHHMVNSADPTFISQDLEAPNLPNVRSTTTQFDLDIRNHRVNDFTSFETTRGPAFEDESTTKSNHRYPDPFPTTKKGGRNVNNGLGEVSQNLNPEIVTDRSYDPNHTFKPPVFITGDEYDGLAMELAYAWSTVSFDYPTADSRTVDIINGKYIPENILPLGLEVWEDKVFVSIPRWKNGVPATLASVPRNSSEKDPILKPYPDWEWHNRLGNCDGLTSVFRMQIDECGRLWVMDSGRVDVATEKSYQLCPPAIFIFDLKTDKLIRKYDLRQDEVRDDSLFSNIVVDVRYGECLSAMAYMVDVWRFGIVVYDFFKDESFRFQHHLFYPDPLASKFDLHGLTFHWTDGIFGIALSPLDVNEDRTLFFHPMSSFREFAVPTSVLRNKRTAEQNLDKFIPIGKPRAKDYGHSSGSTIDKNGIMFFNMVTRDSVWCWDTRKEYIPRNLGVVATSNVSLVFPNDIRVDKDDDPNVWVLSNRLPMYLYGHWDSSDVNFRIYKANIKRAVQNTICDPAYVVPESELSRGYDETC